MENGNMSDDRIAPMDNKGIKYTLGSEEDFRRYMQKFEKSYESENEYRRRFQIFQDALLKIDQHNKQPGISYTMGVNQFTDMTEEEFRKGFLNPCLSSKSCPNT